MKPQNLRRMISFDRRRVLASRIRALRAGVRGLERTELAARRALGLPDDSPDFGEDLSRALCVVAALFGSPPVVREPKFTDLYRYQGRPYVPADRTNVRVTFARASALRTKGRQKGAA